MDVMDGKCSIFFCFLKQVRVITMKQLFLLDLMGGAKYIYISNNMPDFHFNGIQSGFLYKVLENQLIIFMGYLHLLWDSTLKQTVFTSSNICINPFFTSYLILD
jgi:hypothetical protein